MNHKTEPIDIPIAINVGHTEDPEMKQLVDAEYEITHENDNNLYIDINSDYYKKYLSRERFNASRLAFFENSENVEYLTLNLDIVNNTDQNLSINEMYIDVDKSEIDTVPVIYICTTDNYSNCIHFVNQSWFDWKGFTFSYSILEKGESFDGHYKKSKHIDYFDKILIMDLLPDLIDMGYNFEGLKSSIRNRDAKAFVEGEYGRFLYFYITEDDEDFAYFQNCFKPFELKKTSYGEYMGMAYLYGSLKFDDSDLEVDFKAELSLSTSAGWGALSYENDSFDVKLNSFDNNYTLRYPYTTVIEPYGAEYVKLTVAADKSSFHVFQINLKNDNGLNIKSKKIYLHYYYPKN